MYSKLESTHGVRRKDGVYLGVLLIVVRLPLDLGVLIFLNIFLYGVWTRSSSESTDSVSYSGSLSSDSTSKSSASSFFTSNWLMLSN